jgi:hypothetical protein
MDTFDQLSLIEREHLKRLAPRLAQAGIKDWLLVERLLRELELLERSLQHVLPHLPLELLRQLPAAVLRRGNGAPP